jgi:hypothetical protein
MSVQESELLKIGQRLSVLRQREKQLKDDPRRYSNNAVADELREVRAKLRQARRDEKELVAYAQTKLFGCGR